MEVFVFKTSVSNSTDVAMLQSELDQLIKRGQWNFDLEDCDKILRLEIDDSRTKKDVVSLLHNKGILCEELE
ncbi:hypothetical protein AAG747_05430 [Rapidithrix thailandica]|uniref:Uncharacterized protein n=1 Tax=Rapidithrix thailandica TaxID=413964 RepID=A0AAW9S7N5_9BACT